MACAGWRYHEGLACNRGRCVLAKNSGRRSGRARVGFTPGSCRRIVSAMRVSRRQLAAGAFVALVLAGEVAGRWTAEHLPLLGHVPRRPHDGLDLWPAIVIGAKVAIALLLARLFWRLARANRVASAGERIARLRGRRLARPTPTVGLSPRVWLASFAAMSLLYIVPTSSADVTEGCWLLATPWLHTQALPVFAVVAVLVAVLWRTVSRWLADLERYAAAIGRLARQWVLARVTRRRDLVFRAPPRALFGLSFESRPPPLPA